MTHEFHTGVDPKSIFKKRSRCRMGTVASRDEFVVTSADSSLWSSHPSK